MAEMRDIYITMVKESLDYILEDIEDAKLFEMGSIMAKLAEQSAYARRERKIQQEIQAQQEVYKGAGMPQQNTNPPRDFSTAQLVGVRHG